MQESQRAVGLKRHSPREKFVVGHAKRVNVRPAIDSFTPALLRRQVPGGPHEHSGRSELRRGVMREGQAEVRDLEQTPVIHHQVRRLDVAVDETLIVGRREAVRGLQHVLSRTRVGDFPLRPDHGQQRLAGHVLHDEVMSPVVLADEEDLDDIGVGERCRRLRLAHEASDEGRILRKVLAQHLDCDETVEGLLVGLVDNAHAAASQFGNDGVVPNPGGGHFASLLLAHRPGRLQTPGKARPRSHQTNSPNRIPHWKVHSTRTDVRQRLPDRYLRATSPSSLS